MFCNNCGKEIDNEATVCPGCGRPTGAKADAGIAAKPKKKLSKKLIALIVTAAILIALAIPTVMILTANRDLRASDLTETSLIGAYFKFGIPTGSTGGSLKYDDGSVTLGGVKLNAFHVCYEDKEYVLMVDKTDMEELYDYLEDELDESDINAGVNIVIIKAQ